MQETSTRTWADFDGGRDGSSPPPSQPPLPLRPNWQAWSPTELQSDETAPRTLLSLGYVVRQHMEAPHSLSWRQAADRVLDDLARSDVRAFYCIRPRLKARPITEAEVWRPAYPCGFDRLAALDKRHRERAEQGYSYRDEDEFRLDGAEARARSLEVDSYGRGPLLNDLEWAELPELPALQGFAGLIEWLRHEWLTLGIDASCLDEGLQGKVAMRLDEAEALFGPIAGEWPAEPELKQAESEQPADADNAGSQTVSNFAAPIAEPIELICAAPLRLVPVAIPPSGSGITPGALNKAGNAALRQRIDDHQPIKKTKRAWPDKPAMLAELLRQYEERMSLPEAAAATCEEKLGALWGLKQNTVHSYLTEARKSRHGDGEAMKSA